LAPGADEQLLLNAHGAGDQIYTCQANGSAYTWVLKAPDAQLLDSGGAVIGHHYAGPTWESNDGSKVMGKVAENKSSPDPGSIPWLLLHAISHEGTGIMSQVTTIRRLNTKGGKAPATGCDTAHSGSETRVRYEADYLFYGKTSH
jgi:hypothetical protein